MTKTAHDSETAAVGQQVITACAFIHQTVAGEARLFMPRRAITKKFMPGQFELPGGHIDFGEDIVAGLKRELKEEFDMEINVGDPFAAFTYSNPIKGSHSIEVVYFATFDGDASDIVLDPDDHSEYLWVMESQVDELRPEADAETAAIKRGFELLRGEALRY